MTAATDPDSRPAKGFPHYGQLRITRFKLSSQLSQRKCRQNPLAISLQLVR